jgi:cellulose synthase/poly-beta-1,6-N-acetylglucosamine synthase-like glycosyltransferase
MIVEMTVVVTAALAAIHVVLALLAWGYVAADRRRAALPVQAREFTGQVAVFVPCKGLEPDLESNLEAVATQDHPRYTVTYIVESLGDPAVGAIRQVLARNRHAGMVVAGLAERCGQKNHNLLCGIAARGAKAEAIVVCDGDVRPDAGWLRRLTAPLADPRTPVATGFRWILPSQPTVGALVHAIFNAYMSTMIANKLFAMVWGGSLAIRRDFWDGHRIAAKWSESVVDDMTVSAVLVAHRIPRTYVLSCITVTDDGIPALRDTMKWFSRQILFVRYHLFPLWLAILAIWIPTGLAPAAAPILLAWGWWSGSPDLLVCGWLEAGLTLVVALVLLVVRSLGGPNFAAWRWLALTPVALVAGAGAIVETITARHLVWRGIAYTIGANGKVLSISRGAPQSAPVVPAVPLPSPTGHTLSSGE